MTRDARLKLCLSGAALAAAALYFGALLAPRLRPGLPRLSEPVAFTAPGVDAESLRGRPWVADFVFTHCSGPCPTLSANMARLQKRLPDAVSLVSFTVDPEGDTPEVLAAYARALGARPGRWSFARLEAGQLYALMNEGFRLPILIDPGAAPGSRSVHSTKFVLVDPSGVVRGYYDGLSETGLDDLARDAEKLLRRPDV